MSRFFMVQCVEPELLPIEAQHCGNSNFWPFLLLQPWPSYMNVTRIISRYMECVKMNFLCQGF